MSLDTVQGYAKAAASIAVAVAAMFVVAGLFIGGVYVGRGQRAGEINELVRKIADKDVALGNAAASLRGSANVLRAVDDEAEKKLRDAEDQRRLAADAALVAANAQADAARRQAGFDREIELARANPTCAALMQVDLRQVCGL